MFYYLYTQFSHESLFFNIFRYVTFRTVGSLLTALLIFFCLGPWFIRKLKQYQAHGQPIRDDGPESHTLTKKGTPTMGGALILLAIGISTLLWANLENAYIWIVLFVTFGFGIVGSIDDYMKLTKQNTKGLSARQKLIFQSAISVIAVFLIAFNSSSSGVFDLAVPFFKNISISLGWFYVFFASLVIIGASNAVNLTDGLDGLAIGPVMITAACFCIIAYLVGHQIFANYLQLTFISGAGELAVFCSALIGAGLGFLWYNAPPAMVFMGDTGSLAVGGALGVIGVITKHELVLAIIGGLFVFEALSVIIQVIYFKLSGGRRIFLMSPIHHHFEKKGWSEPTIVFRFWIIAIVLALLGLATLKIR